MFLASKGYVLDTPYQMIVPAGTRTAVVEIINDSASDAYVCLGSIPTTHEDSFVIPAGKSYFTSAPSSNVISASGSGKIIVITDFSK